MISLIKLDLWLMRWGLLFIFPFGLIAGAFLYTDSSMTGFILVFVMDLTLTQMDEKQKTRRFMLSLPLPLKTFFQARTLGVIFIGAAWVLFESIGRLIGFGDVTFRDIFTQSITHFATMIVLAPIIIAMFTLLKHPVLKWGLTFFVYMATVLFGTLLGFFVTRFIDLGALVYVLSAAYLLLAVGLCWLILLIANGIRARRDLV
ncbi:ABC-2 transporter permease [Lentibacillus sediminis]|uniref:ABC-2 transporter permease n=1 Tax=Lentibacillus sediminis TaxID=1940529 RepID=UPI000C1C51ED|nr:ABC-2 transporter permease [Lentibacillus sediminis]